MGLYEEMSVEEAPEEAPKDDEPQLSPAELALQKEKERFHQEVVEAAEEIFNMFDKDGDGKLTLDEVRKGFASIGMELSKDDFDNMIAEIDEDNDGTLTQDEFTHMAARSMEHDIDDL